MSKAVLSEEITLPIKVETSHLITEDDKPLDNFLTEKQERLLTEPLYSSWKAPENRPFLVAANVGVFNSIHLSATVPDVFLSLDVEINPEWWENQHRSYFIWEFGKAPDVVIEIVSNKIGEEDSKKFIRYRQMGVTYYVIFDPYKHLKGEILSIYVLGSGRYILKEEATFPEIGLGLTLWPGNFENTSSPSWLRWTDLEGNLIPTGIERASIEELRADEEKLRADEQAKLAYEEKLRADEEKLRADEQAKLAHEEKLRADEEKLRADEQAKLAYEEKLRADEQAKLAYEEKLRADEEKLRADEQAKLAYEEKLRADRLAAKLKELGLDPDSLT